jgi:TonB family protein
MADREDELMNVMSGYFRCAIALLATLLFGCLGNVDGDLLLKRYVPGEATPVETTNKARIIINSPPGAKGTYVDNVKSQLGSRWYYYVSEGKDRYRPGSATLSFGITPEGRVRNVQVIKNTSNAAFAAMCRRVVEEAKFAPPTEEASKLMKDGELKFRLSFNYLSSAPTPATSAH